MPTRKTRLTTCERAKYLASALELLDAGLISEIPAEWADNCSPLEIQIAPSPISVACDLVDGRGSYAVLIRLLPRRSGMLQDCRINTEWDEDIELECFKEETMDVDFGSQWYRLKDILNARILNLPLHPGRLVEGWLLFAGLRVMPTKYRNFDVVPFRLSLWDYFCHEIIAAGSLSVLRTPRRVEPSVGRGTGLNGSTEIQLQQSPSEEARLRYLELIALEKSRTTKISPAGDGSS